MIFPDLIKSYNILRSDILIQKLKHIGIIKMVKIMLYVRFLLREEVLKKLHQSHLIST